MRGGCAGLHLNLAIIGTSPRGIASPHGREARGASPPRLSLQRAPGARSSDSRGVAPTRRVSRAAWQEGGAPLGAGRTEPRARRRALRLSPWPSHFVAGSQMATRFPPALCPVPPSQKGVLRSHLPLQSPSWVEVVTVWFLSVERTAHFKIFSFRKNLFVPLHHPCDAARGTRSEGFGGGVALFAGAAAEPFRVSAFLPHALRARGPCAPVGAPSCPIGILSV